MNLLPLLGVEVLCLRWYLRKRLPRTVSGTAQHVDGRIAFLNSPWKRKSPTTVSAKKRCRQQQRCSRHTRNEIPKLWLYLFAIPWLCSTFTLATELLVLRYVSSISNIVPCSAYLTSLGKHAWYAFKNDFTSLLIRRHILGFTHHVRSVLREKLNAPNWTFLASAFYQMNSMYAKLKCMTKIACMSGPKSNHRSSNWASCFLFNIDTLF